MTDLAHTAANGAVAKAGVRRTGDRCLRVRNAAAVSVLGIKGAIWGAIAFLLLMVGLGSAAMAIVMSLRLTALDRDHDLSARLAGVHEKLQYLTTDLLVIVSLEGGEARLPVARDAWRRIVRDVADICAVVGSPATDDRNYLMPLCAHIESASSML